MAGGTANATPMAGTGADRYRWIVERTIAWLVLSRRLAIRYKRRINLHLAFLSSPALLYATIRQNESVSNLSSSYAAFSNLGSVLEHRLKVIGEVRLAVKVAVINMKGGVGKSTLCTNLAWHFSAMSRWKKRVLLIDLDPQFNASQYMMGVTRYERDIVKAGAPTVWDIFEQQSRAPGLRSSNRSLNDAVIRIASFTTGQYIDLIPSQLDLSFTLKNPSQKEHLLSNFIADVEDKYDLVIVDCAPTESVLTTAAYLTADHILVPVKPEFLSTIGLPLIRQSLGDFAKSYRKTVSVSGIGFNMCSDYSPEENISKAEVKKLAASFGWHVFNEEVPYSRSFPKGAREGKPIFATSYARSTVSSEVASFCNAFARQVML